MSFLSLHRSHICASRGAARESCRACWVRTRGHRQGLVRVYGCSYDCAMMCCKGGLSPKTTSYMLFRELEILFCMNLAVRVTYCSYATRHRGLEVKHLMLMLHALIPVLFAIRICRCCRKTKKGGASVLYAYRASLSEIPVCLAGTCQGVEFQNCILPSAYPDTHGGVGDVNGAQLNL
jgi:hypothetical protein